MTNFIANIRELLPLWQQADLFPKVMSALLFISPLIITLIGMVAITIQIRKGKK